MYPLSFLLSTIEYIQQIFISIDVYFSSVIAIWFCFYDFFGGVGCAGSLLLHRLFCSCGELGLFFLVMCTLLIAVASLIVEHKL